MDKQKKVFKIFFYSRKNIEFAVDDMSDCLPYHYRNLTRSTIERLSKLTRTYKNDARVYSDGAVITVYRERKNK